MIKVVNGRTVEKDGATITFSEDYATVERDGSIFRVYKERASFGEVAGILIEAASATNEADEPVDPARTRELAQDVLEAYAALGGKAKIV